MADEVVNEGAEVEAVDVEIEATAEELDELSKYKVTAEEAAALHTPEDVNRFLERRVAQIRQERLEKKAEEMTEAAVNPLKEQLDAALTSKNELQLQLLEIKYGLDDDGKQALVDTGLQGDALIAYAEKHGARLGGAAKAAATVEEKKDEAPSLTDLVLQKLGGDGSKKEDRDNKTASDDDFNILAKALTGKK